MRWMMVIGMMSWSILSALGQSISVEVSADEVEVGEHFMISYTVQGGDDIELPSFKKFEVLQTGSSSSIELANGKLSKSTTYSFTLRAWEPGTYTIPSASIQAKGKRIRSAPIQIRVKDNGQMQPLQRGQSGSARQNLPDAGDNPRDVILAVAEADKSKAYVGEQVTITYKLLTRVNYNTMDIDKAPLYKGFLTQDMEVDDINAISETTYRGQRYVSQIFRRQALYGTYPGTFTLEPLHLKGVVLMPEHYPFMGSNPITTPKNVLLPTNKVTLQILPLPEKGQPADFSGLVGQMDADRSISATKVRAGETVKLYYSITGRGNLKAAVYPDFKYPDGVEAFEPQTESMEREYDGLQLGGIRNFEQALVFREPGVYTIPSYSFSYFDPRVEQYISKELPEIRIEVNESVASAGDKADGQTFLSDISSGWQPKSKLNLGWAAVASAMTLPVLGWMFLVLYTRRKGRKKTSKELDDFGGLPDLQGLEEKERYAAVAEYLRSQLMAVFNLKDDEGLQMWLSVLPDRDIAFRVQYILSSCDRVRYSPLGAEPAGDLLNQAVDVLTGIEAKKGEVLP